MSIPTPTIGRIVLFRGSDGEDRPAIVTHVWSDFCVNLYVFPKDSSDTNTGPRTSVTHIGPETNEQPTTGPSWRWMPFQIQTAGTRHQDVPKNTIPVPQSSIRVTEELIDSIIDASTWTDTKIGRKTTVVCLTLPNGFEVIESSGCVDPLNYDHALGVEICKKRIVDQVWKLEGYALANDLTKGGVSNDED